jgi:hypothetical protein
MYGEGSVGFSLTCLWFKMEEGEILARTTAAGLFRLTSKGRKTYRFSKEG